MAKRFSTRETALLTLPVVFVGALGLWLSKRPAATLTFNQPFQLVVEKVTRETPSPREVSQGYDTKIGIVLTHRGPQPAWWGVQNGYSGTYGQGVLFEKKSGRHITRPFYWEPAYDPKTKRYTARYLLSLVKVKSDDELRLRDRIAPAATGLFQCAPVKFDVLARKAGETTTVPVVSRDPRMALVGWTIATAPPSEHNGGTHWLRVSPRFRPDAPSNSNFSFQANFQVVDARGEAILLSNSNSNSAYSPSWQDERPGKMRRRTASWNFDMDKVSLAKKRGALWVRGEAWTDDNWPLKVNIPLRDASGKILTTRPAKAQFRVLAVSKRRATASEKRNSKADLVVSVRLGNLKSGDEKMHLWNWQESFSPHLVDNLGRETWKYASGASAATSVALNWSRSGADAIVFEYGVNLSKLPRDARKVWFKNEIGVEGGERVPVKVQVR